MRLKIVSVDEPGSPSHIKVINAQTGELVENAVHVRFEFDTVNGWLGHIVICPEVDIEADVVVVAEMPPVRGYPNQH
jgi:phosphopantothenoylcysteine synthetase/decarboxylase